MRSELFGKGWQANQCLQQIAGLAGTDADFLYIYMLIDHFDSKNN